MNFNERIQKVCLNEYGGSERKMTIILDDGYKYLLKFPDPIREKGATISYINNAFSEYLGCKIAKILGLPVQDVLLGEIQLPEKDLKIACACKDLRSKGTRMNEISKVQLSNVDASDSKFLNLESIDFVINKLGVDGLSEFYYQMFILDAFIGNTDRHNGNWAVLVDENEDLAICPIYDCGSSFSPLLGDTDLDNVNTQQVALSVCSILNGADGKRINYYNYLLGATNDNINKALLSLVSRMNLNEIFQLIDSTDYISEKRKIFYKELVDIRFNRMMIPALEKIFSEQFNYSKDISNIDFFAFYKSNISKVSELPLFDKVSVRIDGVQLRVSRVNKKYALLLDEGDNCVGLLPIRSKNTEVEKCVRVLSYWKESLKVKTGKMNLF